MQEKLSLAVQQYHISLVIRQSFFPSKIDLSYKTDLDLWDCLIHKTRSIAKSHRTVLVICSQSREGKTLSYSRINMVLWH